MPPETVRVFFKGLLVEAPGCVCALWNFRGVGLCNEIERVAPAGGLGVYSSVTVASRICEALLAMPVGPVQSPPGPAPQL